VQRAKLPTTGLTKVTAESFAAWKEARAKRRAAELESRRVEEAKRTGTKGYTVLSGRDLFSFDPSLFVDDADADADVYEEEEDGAGGGAEGAAAAGGAGRDDGGAAGGAGGGGGGAAGGAGGGGIDESAFLEGGDEGLDDLLCEDDEEGEEGEGEGDEEGEGGGEGDD
jgi:hypothetical protein